MLHKGGLPIINAILWVVPLPRIPVTTRINIFLVGDPYKPSFATVTGRGGQSKIDILTWLYLPPLIPKLEKLLIDVSALHVWKPSSKPKKASYHSIHVWSMETSIYSTCLHLVDFYGECR